ncbi:phosphatase PAP2 family protein [Nocardioides albertanoniae]|uniref:phosphatase PAP2 family protein n=1 Tax=Nocardioides albertanoniae TaxID=1175486 RepID=UPI001B86D933|nr:phosphatase PAP2 family protein [Nocardioides albertanoniae]
MILTVLAAGPLQELDTHGHEYWARMLPPQAQHILQNVLDPIAGQTVCLPVLGVVAAVIAYRRRSWRPIICAAAAEAAFYIGVGGFKVLLARPAPTERDAEFFAGGLLKDGWHGISYPSGHAAEAVLIYGTVVYLIARYTGASRLLVRLLAAGVGVIALNAVAVSYTLGWHWASDLFAGLLTGGLLLRLLVWWDTDAIARERAERERAEERELIAMEHERTDDIAA